MQDVTNFIQMLMSDPKLALGVVAFCGAMALLVLVLWVLRIMRRRREQALGQPAMTADQMRQYAQPPIFTAAINGGSGAGSMSHRSVEELLAVEDSLMALRELYQRKLIPAEVYIKESQKYTQSL
jgi:hypothetical protein